MITTNLPQLLPPLKQPIAKQIVRFQQGRTSKAAPLKGQDQYSSPRSPWLPQLQRLWGPSLGCRWNNRTIHKSVIRKVEHPEHLEAHWPNQPGHLVIDLAMGERSVKGTLQLERYVDYLFRERVVRFEERGEASIGFGEGRLLGQQRMGLGQVIEVVHDEVEPQELLFLFLVMGPALIGSPRGDKSGHLLKYFLMPPQARRNKVVQVGSQKKVIFTDFVIRPSPLPDVSTLAHAWSFVCPVSLQRQVLARDVTRDVNTLNQTRNLNRALEKGSTGSRIGEIGLEGGQRQQLRPKPYFVSSSQRLFHVLPPKQQMIVIPGQRISLWVPEGIGCH